MQKSFMALLLLLISQTTNADMASFYGYECAGRVMANGQPFNPEALTAASYRYPLGTRLLVTNPANGLSVEVTITDRGPARRLHRIIDLSESAFKQIADTRLGVIPVTISRRNAAGIPQTLTTK